MFSFYTYICTGFTDGKAAICVTGFLTRGGLSLQDCLGVRNHGLSVSGEARDLLHDATPLTAACSYFRKLVALTFLEMGQQIRATPGQPRAVLPGLFGKRARYEAGGRQGQAGWGRQTEREEGSAGPGERWPHRTLSPGRWH